jgi:DNA-binding NarL/FixJ family response regulator
VTSVATAGFSLARHHLLWKAPPMPDSRIKVVIVDDHPLFRGGLRQVIESDPEFQLIGEAGDGPGGLQLIREQKPDVAILDVNLPGLSGLEIAQKLQHRRIPTRLIILTMYKEEETFNRAMDLGVSGFVLKENAVQDIVTGLKTVAAGEPYLSPSISGYLLRRRSRSESLVVRKPGLDDLTRAERRILLMIAQKKTSREIAVELSISPRTVEAHRANICTKLELHGSHSLLQFALENRSSL